MKFLVSNTVHQSPETLRDQAQNYGFLLPEALMVVHVSATSAIPLESFQRAVEDLPNVVINPTRMPTTWGDMIGPHVANLRFALADLGSFDRFCFSSSQELLFRPGLRDRLESFDAGYDFENEFRSGKKGSLEEIVEADPAFLKMRKAEGINRIVWSQIDGAFFPWEFASELVVLCERYLNLESKTRGYFREELIPSTLFHARYPEARCCYPYVLKTNAFSIWIDEYVGQWIQWEYFRRAAQRIMRVRYPRFADMYLYGILRSGNTDSLRRYEFSRKVRRVDLAGIYGLKRVHDALDDPVRSAIRKDASAWMESHTQVQ